MTERYAKLCPRRMAYHGATEGAGFLLATPVSCARTALRRVIQRVLWAQIRAVLLNSTAHAGLGMQGSQMT